LALTGVLGIGEGHLFHHRKARRLVSGDFAKSGSLFQDFPKASQSLAETRMSLFQGTDSPSLPDIRSWCSTMVWYK
ncbi:hypothetical protein, partial [Pseudomonas shirazica]|uniref:hypothetical protein n=1 Tax=Pseudomonas shirazica TaxID=1940636 RepID=UPI003AB097AC